MEIDFKNILVFNKMEDFIKNVKNNDNEDNRIAILSIVENFRDQDEQEILEEFLTKVIEFAIENKIKGDSLNSIIEPFDEDQDANNIIIIVCRDYICDKNCVKYLVENLQNLNDAVYLLGEAIEKRRKVNYGVISENILFAFDHSLTNYEIDELMMSVETYKARSLEGETENMIAYLESKRVFEESEYIKPSWVSLREGENISLLTTVSLGKNSEGDDVKFKEIEQGFDNFFYEFSKEKNSEEDEKEGFFYSDLSGATKKAIQNFLNVSTKTESHDMGFEVGQTERVWGPSNSFKDKGCSSGPNGEGDCRMLQCMCLEIDYDASSTIYTGNTPSWFFGKCDHCNKFIKNMSHALRFPMKDGGWKGSYCSFECLTNGSPCPIGKEENILLGIMKRNTLRTGIMDRSSF